MKAQERDSQYKIGNRKRHTVSLLLAMIGLTGWFTLPVLAGLSSTANTTRQMTPPVANAWTSNGPEGASITSLAIDPGNPNTLYAGSDAGQVFKSTNGGASWRAPEIRLTEKPVTALTIDPLNSTTIYA